MCPVVDSTLYSHMCVAYNNWGMSYNREVQCNKALFSILDKNDTRFRDLHTTLDFLSIALQRQGLGATHNY